MNMKGVKRSKDLDFEVAEYLANAIDRLIDAMENEDLLHLDIYKEEVESSARMVEEEYDSWIYNYYLRGGWKDDVIE